MNLTTFQMNSITTVNGEKQLVQTFYGLKRFISLQAYCSMGDGTFVQKELWKRGGKTW